MPKLSMAVSNIKTNSFNSFNITTSSYIQYEGYQTFMKNDRVCYCSLNFSIVNSPSGDTTMISGLPVPKGADRQMVVLAQGTGVLRGYINKSGQLKTDGSWTNGWVSGTLMYPI